MDFHVCSIADGAAPVEHVGWVLFCLMLNVACGKKTWAEHWELHSARVLFEPAPGT